VQYRIPNNTALLVIEAKFEPDSIIVNINKLKSYQFYNEDQLVTITSKQSIIGQVAPQQRTKVLGQDGTLHYMEVDSNSQVGDIHQKEEGRRATHYKDDIHVYNMTKCDIEAYVVKADQNEGRHLCAAKQEKAQNTTNIATYGTIYMAEYGTTYMAKHGTIYLVVHFSTWH
jgi:hypothetical protein